MMIMITIIMVRMVMMMMAEGDFRMENSHMCFAWGSLASLTRGPVTLVSKIYFALLKKYRNLNVFLQACNPALYVRV